MKTLNVLTAIVASTGLAASALGQANGTFVIEVRLVVDGDPNAPIGAGITSYAPGDGATRVGVSLQARVTQTATGTNVGSGNYGIAAVLAQAGTPAGRAQFTHDDAAFSGGSYLALRRGQTSTNLGTDGLPEAGLFGGQNNPQDFVGGAGRGFRELGNGQFDSADFNSLTGNAPTANGTNNASANGYFTNSLGGVTGIVGTVQIINDSAPTAYSVGVVSPWYNLYRVYFDPNAVTNTVSRDVTVIFSGRIVAAVRATVISGVGTTLSLGGANGSQRDVTGLSATFRVGPIPTPAGGALLGLGGLVAARRRRR